MAACRFSCAPCLAAYRSCCPAPASRWPIISTRLGRHGVTHLSGTPTHWRRALMIAGHRARSRRDTSGCPARSPTRRSSTSLRSALSASRRRPRLRLDRGRRRLRGPRRARRLSRRIRRTQPRRRRDEGAAKARCASARRAPRRAISAPTRALADARRLRRYRRHGGVARRPL